MLGIAMLDEVRKLLEGKSIMIVSKETGIDHHWLYRIARGDVASPNLKRLETLLEYLRDGTLPSSNP